MFSANLSECFGIKMMIFRCRNGRTAFNVVILPFMCAFLVAGSGQRFLLLVHFDPCPN